MSSTRSRGYVPVLSPCLRPCPVTASAFWMFVVVLGLSVPAQAQDGPPTQAVGMLQIDEVSADVMRAAQASVAGPDRQGKDGPLAAVGMELALLYHQHQAAGASGVQSLRAAARPKTSDEGRLGGQSRTHSPLSADGRLVTVDAIAADDSSVLLRELRELGLEGGATAGTVVSGRLPIAAIEEAASLPSLRAMMPSYARTHAGSVESEADSAHRAVDARTNLGVDGSGQKVCVLSDSYNQNSTAATSASDDVQSGDLPGTGNPEGDTTRVEVLDDTDTDGSDEGRAMLQLIHDIAPGAALGFHTATAGGLASFASGIQDLADAGCTVIVDDVRFNTEPFYQDGPVANAVDDVVNDSIPVRVTYFSSAGNEGEDSYEAPFRNSGEPGVINTSSVAHDFDGENGALPPTDTQQAITIAPGGTFQIFSFQWTDPSGQVEGSSAPDTDIDIALVNESGTIVARSEGSNVAVPVESLEYTNNESSEVTVNLVIEKASGPDPDEVKYVYTRGDFTIDEYNTDGPTLYGHSMAEGAMAVAAAPFFNTDRFNAGIDSSAILDFFSSRGGLEIRFDQNGDELGSFVPREKPDVTGTDFVDNTFFGSDIDIQDPDGFPNFPGTSAAAPNIAAIAALIQQADLGLGPTEVYDRLESTAVDVRFRQQLENGSISDELDPTGAGVDPWSGHGFARADRAVPAPAGVQITDASASASSNNRRAIELTWKNVGEERESIDEFLLERRYFDGPFVEQERIPAGSTTEFARTIEDLPVGEHTFRITALRDDSTVAVGTTSAVLRRDGVDVSVFPNPFREAANLSVTLPEDRTDEGQIEIGKIEIRIFDVLGRQVAKQIESDISRIERSGSQLISLNTRQIRSLGSGVYFFQVTGETFQQTTKAVRVR